MSGLGTSPLSALDRRFAAFIKRLANEDELVALGAAVASWQSREGNVCANLRALAGTVPDGVADGDESPRLPEFEEWTAALRKSPVVGSPGAFTPLVLDGAGRLYLHRLWEFERQLSEDILRHSASEVADVDWGMFRAGVDRLFPATARGEVDWQKVSCFAAMRRRLCVISGGPGTGKTWTVGVLLALLLEQPGAERLRCGFAAPTGKAAARLHESIEALKARLPMSDAVRARMPAGAATLHRLLGLREGSAEARFNATNPLPLDVVIVDEASMVDLPLMSRLFAAVPATARIILLGDRDQLASVEAGAVLADICGAGRLNDFSPDFASHCQRVLGEKLPHASEHKQPLRDCVVHLEKNYRFSGGTGLLELSQAVRVGDAAGALQCLAHGSGASVTRRDLPRVQNLKRELRRTVEEHLAPCFTKEGAEEVLRALRRFRILCAVRHGPFGVEAVNALVEGILAEAGVIDVRGVLYSGRPIMIVENDYALGLFNGDLGLVFTDPETGGLSVFFADGAGAVRKISPARLPRHETAFAMTVHKSQGSEFESVLLLLPERDSPVLTRELIYTGVTRASKRVEVWALEAMMTKTISRRIERSSGLADTLNSVEVTGKIS